MNNQFINVISVRISPTVWDKLDHDVHRGIHLLKQLREAGVPIKGAVWPTGVESGRLTHFIDDLFGDLVWEWQP